MTEQTKLKTNHNIRIVNLATGDNVLCMFGEVRDDNEKVIGYRMLYPYSLLVSFKDFLISDATVPLVLTPLLALCSALL